MGEAPAEQSKGVISYLQDLCYNVKILDFENADYLKKVDPFIKVPRNQNEAYKRKYARIWRQAERAELDGIEMDDTWSEVKRDDSMSVLPGRFVYDLKRTDDGRIKAFKARYVVAGHRQKEGIDYEEVHAATSQMRTTKIILALAVTCGIDLQHWDISNAFTNGVLDKELYARHPQSYPGVFGTVLRLWKSLIWSQTS